MKNTKKSAAKLVILMLLALISAPIVTGCDFEYSTYKHGKSTWFNWNDR
ncbi:MAG: hypothetical protein V4674_00890 [Patescibacteria group bacterium]